MNTHHNGYQQPMQRWFWTFYVFVYKKSWYKPFIEISENLFLNKFRRMARFLALIPL